MSLRLRLALLYTLLLAGVLAVFGALSFVLVSKRLYAAVDESLRAEAEAVEQAIDPGDAPLTSQRVLESFQRNVDERVKAVVENVIGNLPALGRDMQALMTRLEQLEEKIAALEKKKG